MNNSILYCLNRLLPLMPDTRAFGLRSRLWRIAGIDIDPTARLVASVRIMGCFPLHIGAYTYIGHESLIVGGDAPISIGANCDLGPRVVVVNGSHVFGHLSNSNRAAGEGISNPIDIDDGVWIGANCTILGGVRIGARAVIGAGSVVTRDVAPDTIALGVPCHAVKSWDADGSRWKSCLSTTAAVA